MRRYSPNPEIRPIPRGCDVVVDPEIYDGIDAAKQIYDGDHGLALQTADTIAALTRGHDGPAFFVDSTSYSGGQFTINGTYCIEGSGGYKRSVAHLRHLSQPGGLCVYNAVVNEKGQIGLGRMRQKTAFNNADDLTPAAGLYQSLPYDTHASRPSENNRLPLMKPIHVAQLELCEEWGMPTAISHQYVKNGDYRPYAYTDGLLFDGHIPWTPAVIFRMDVVENVFLRQLSGMGENQADGDRMSDIRFYNINDLLKQDNLPDDTRTFLTIYQLLERTAL